MRRRLLIVSNPGAGLTHSSLIDDTARLLKEAGVSVTRVQPPGIAAVRAAVAEAAASGAYDTIVAAGGDGTIRHVAAALIGSNVPLGIIPGGTGNVLAHEIGLKSTPAAIAHMLIEGPTVEVACANANGEPFLLMAGAGFDARVLAELDQRAKGLVGKVAYAFPLIGGLFRPLDRLTVTVDRHPHQASWAVICNARHYGGGFVLAHRTGIHQRGLEAILFKPQNRAALTAMLTSLARGHLTDHVAKGEVEMIPCTHVTISARSSVPVQIDGDVLGTTPLEIEAGTAHVRLIVPPGHTSGSGTTTR